jgi:hypothetical protein
LLMLACCSTKTPEREAMEAFIVACLDAATLRLDDGVSDARSVALSLRAPCDPEFARSRDVFARNMNPAGAEIFHREDDAVFMRIAMVVVLGERGKRRGPGSAVGI